MKRSLRRQIESELPEIIDVTCCESDGMSYIVLKSLSKEMLIKDFLNLKAELE